LEPIKKGEFLTEYFGELVDGEEMAARQEWYDMENIFYSFNLNEVTDLDSKLIGNKMRFANHSKAKKNAYAKVLFINGQHKICFFACKNIKKYEEILFDYDGTDQLCLKYEWINDKIKPGNKKHSDHLSMIHSDQESQKNSEEPLLKNKRKRNIQNGICNSKTTTQNRNRK
jgi:hypothetical protein